MEEISSLEDLLDLQVLDSDIDRLLDRRTNLPELDAYRVAHDELSGIEQQLAELSARMREIDLASDKSDGELKLEEAKAHREEQRLYAGGAYGARCGISQGRSRDVAAKDLNP